MLTFTDKWILYPADYHDYFMKARQKKNIHINDYVNMIDSNNNIFGHKPFYSITNYFYDTRKKIDKFLNNLNYKDLYLYIPEYNSSMF